MSERVKAYINHHVLVWARHTAGYSLEEAARKIGVNTEKLRAWEGDEDKPTLRQLRIVAKTYKRPSALFYRSTTPTEPPMLTDFRHLPNVDKKFTPKLLYEIRRAYDRRSIALELTEQIGESPRVFPLQADITEEPESLALRIREALGVTLADQYSWRDHYTALRNWIAAVENLGILVFHVRNVDLSLMRGFSIGEHPFPVVGINGKDSPRGRIFTLIHEVVHIVLQNGGLCDLHESDSTINGFLETYCNQVAAEVLVPGDTLLKERAVIENEGNDWDNWRLLELSNRFMVSQEVILRRLLSLRRTTKAFYQHKREEYEEIYERERSRRSGAVPYYRLVLRDNGPAFTSLVLSAYHNEAISSRDLSNFLGGIKLNHVTKIEHAIIGGEGGVDI